MNRRFVRVIIVLLVATAGCGGTRSNNEPSPADERARPVAKEAGLPAAQAVDGKAEARPKNKQRFQPVDFGESATGNADSPSAQTRSVIAEQQVQSVIVALQPFQILL